MQTLPIGVDFPWRFLIHFADVSRTAPGFSLFPRQHLEVSSSKKYYFKNCGDTTGYLKWTMRKTSAALKGKAVAEDLDARLFNRLLGKTTGCVSWQRGNVSVMFWRGFSFSVCGSRWLIGYQGVINQGWKQGQNREFDGADSFHSLFALIKFSFYLYCESFVQFY